MHKQCEVTECPLHVDGIEVPYRGLETATVVIVGESPGWEEEKDKQCFVGRSGRLLSQVIASAGLMWQDIFLTNTTRCRLKKDEMTAPGMKATINCCRDKLDLALDTIQPKLIIPLGAIALERIKGVKVAITKERGLWFWSDRYKCQVLPTYHPAYILRNPNFTKMLQSDLDKAARFVENDYEIVTDSDSDIAYKEVESIRPLLDGGFPRDLEGTMITSLDTETQGVKWYSPNSVVISYQVAASMSEGHTVILHEEVPTGEGDFDITVQRGGTKKAPLFESVGIKKCSNYDAKIDELHELMGRDDIKKYFMNAKFDRHQITNLGVTEWEACVLDVGLAAHALDSERFRNTGLATLIEVFTDNDLRHKDDVTKAEKSDMLSLLKEDREKFVKYASIDPVATLQVAMVVKDELIKDPETLNYYIHFVHPTEVDLLWEMERNGVKIDLEKLPVVKEELLELRSKKVAQFRALCPREVQDAHSGSKFRLTRAAVLHDAMFDYSLFNKNNEWEEHTMGFHIQPIRTSPKTGKPVFDKQVREELLGKAIPTKARELIAVYEEWSQVNTLVSRYIGQIEEGLDPAGWLHPSYSLTFTGSGRTGARSPSIQNFPKRGENAYFIRSLIIAPDGYVLLHVDHAVSELRWIAQVAHERQLRKIFEEDGDPHVTTAENVTGEDFSGDIPKAEYKSKRQKAKPINFGFSYGMSSFGLQSYARVSYGVIMTDRQAELWRGNYFDFYADIIPWHERSKTKLRQQGYLRHVFGRRRILPEIHSHNTSVQRKAERIGINFEIQGPSSDYTLMGGRESINHPDFDRAEISVNLFIHDAFAYYVKEDRVDFYWPIIKDSMELPDISKFNVTLEVPFKADGEVGPNLADTKSIGG